MNLNDLANYASASAPPLAYPVEDVPAIAGIPRTKVFEAIRRGQLTARKLGRSTIIEHRELVRFLASLPVRGRKPEPFAV